MGTLTPLPRPLVPSSPLPDPDASGSLLTTVSTTTTGTTVINQTWVRDTLAPSVHV